MKITSCELQESFEGVSVDPTTGVVTADANLDDSPDIRTAKVLVSGTFNGVAFSQEAMIDQDTVNRYIWCGYSGATPTSFDDSGNGTRYTASNGLQVTVNTRDNYQGVLCHWIMIPSGSSFQLLEALDAAGTNIKKYGAEILPTASNAIKDTNHRAYYMWHLTSGERYMERATKFVISNK